jgi:hypothetical protein
MPRYLSLEMVLAAFGNIANGKDPQNEFLTYFARALCCADGANRAALHEAARSLALKYDLVSKQSRRGILRYEQYGKRHLADAVDTQEPSPAR